MDPNEERRLQQLLESVEKEERDLVRSFRNEQAIVRRQLFGDNHQEDILIETEDEDDIDHIEEFHHNTDSETDENHSQEFQVNITTFYTTSIYVPIFYCKSGIEFVHIYLTKMWNTKSSLYTIKDMLRNI